MPTAGRLAALWQSRCPGICWQTGSPGRPANRSQQARRSLRTAVALRRLNVRQQSYPGCLHTIHWTAARRWRTGAGGGSIPAEDCLAPPASTLSRACRGVPHRTSASAIAAAVSVKAGSPQKRASSRAGPHSWASTAALCAWCSHDQCQEGNVSTACEPKFAIPPG